MLHSISRYLITALPLCFVLPIQAEDDFTSWYNLKPRKYSFFEASYLVAANVDASNVNQEFGWSQSKVRALTTVSHTDQSDWSIWGSLQHSTLSGDIRLPDNTAVPDSVTNTRAGTTYRYFDDNWMLGGSMVIQNSGEDFASSDETGAQGTLMGQYQFNTDWSLWGSLQYEGLTEDAIIPGGGFRYQNEQLEIMLGYPWAQLSWRPVSELQFKAIWYGDPWYSDVTWFLPAGWRVGIGAQQRHDAFFYDLQPKDNYQIQLRQIQVDAFVSYELPDYRYVTLRLGQLMDREIFADKAYTKNSDNARDIKDGLVGELGISMWW